MGLPATLAELGISAEKFEFMAKKATGFEYGHEEALGVMKPLYWQDVLNIYRAAK
jgi:alcohol dehydrogenase YqhD (iron-dependent ADH family)